MINLSSYFYHKLTCELLDGYPEIVQFDYFDSATQNNLNVIFVPRKHSLTLLNGKKQLDNNFSYQTLDKWIQLISLTEL